MSNINNEVSLCYTAAHTTVADKQNLIFQKLLFRMKLIGSFNNVITFLSNRFVSRRYLYISF